MSDTNKQIDMLIAKHLGEVPVMAKRAIRKICYDYELWLGPPEQDKSQEVPFKEWIDDYNAK